MPKKVRVIFHIEESWDRPIIGTRMLEIELTDEMLAEVDQLYPVPDNEKEFAEWDKIHKARSELRDMIGAAFNMYKRDVLNQIIDWAKKQRVEA